jgi:hypothetical protein
MPLVASKLTRVTLDAARTIESGNSIRVHNICIANGTASNIVVQVTDADDTNILDLAVLANDKAEYTAVFIADNGLKFASEGDAGVVATVAHSAAGA